ncbi:unnamed protein product [Effrenium voratum]|uniref:UBC core domain-containing protein n=1 Tax=Effrenium voratum TaxID=2562239 RepID=A0AA36N6Y6_9DINO|nr:unnamed protein product [Effrenium voratum]CAJ1394819.1 unnamed protein product [Effrenium voratum]CAJ1429057.1 unnamed protein product [Effrenium voratum]
MDQLKKFNTWLKEHSKQEPVRSDPKGKEEDPFLLEEDQDEEIGGLLQQYGVLLEYERMQDLLPSGMYVLPCFDSVLTWQGALFVRQGLYKGAVFKFRLVLPEEYPDQGPDLYFTSDVFHPMVDPKTGQVELGSLFPEWRPGRDFAAFALPHLHRAFLRREYFASSSRPALNPEARQLFISDPTAFAERARSCAKTSLLHVYDNASGSALQFTKGPMEAHDTIIEHLKADTSSSLEERKTAFIDWFCDHYAHKRTRVGVAQGDAEAETILFDAKAQPKAGYPKAPVKAAPPILSRSSILGAGNTPSADEEFF